MSVKKTRFTVSDIVQRLNLKNVQECYDMMSPIMRQFLDEIADLSYAQGQIDTLLSVVKQMGSA